MRSEDARREARQFERIDAAFKAGDLDALRAAVDDRQARTRIDDCETPLDLARRAGLTEIAAQLTRD